MITVKRFNIDPPVNREHHPVAQISPHCGPIQQLHYYCKAIVLICLYLFQLAPTCKHDPKRPQLILQMTTSLALQLQIFE